MSWLGLEGRVVVVTGGSGGIGRACLAGFHAEGARVVSLDRSEAEARDVARALDPSGGSALGLACDIGDPAAIAAAAGEVAARLGGADVVVNNAGILRPAPLDGVSVADWAAMLQVNLTGSLLVAQAFAPQMIGRTKDGMHTKPHAICDSQGRRIGLFVTAGQVSDYIGARALLGSLPNVDWLLGDRGYDADWFREALKDKRDTRVYPRSTAAQESHELRQALIQTAQPDRDHVRQAQGLAA